MKKILNNIPIIRLFIVAYLALLIGLVIIRLIEYKNLQNVQNIISKAIGSSHKRDAVIIRMRKGADYVQVNVLRLLFYTDKQAQSKAEKTIITESNTNDSNIAAYENFISDQQEKDFFAKLKLNKEQYAKNIDTLTQLIREGKQSEAVSFNSQFLASSFDKYHQATSELTDYINKRDNIIVEAKQTDIKEIEKISLWLNVAILVLLVFLGIILSRAIGKLRTTNFQLAESEHKYRSLVEHTNELINKTDKNGRFFFASNSLKEKLEYPDEELFSLRIPDILADESQHQYRPNPIKSEVGEMIKTTQKTFISKSGKKIIVEGTVILDYTKEIFTGATAYFNDITEKIQLHSNLLSSEEKYRQLFNFTPLPMWLYESETFKIIQVNKAAVNHYGYSENEFATMTILDIRPQEDIPGIKKILKNLNQPNKIFQGEFRHLKKSGEKMDVLVSSIPIILNGKTLRLSIAIDVTEKKLFEQKLTAAIIKTQEDERYEIGGELHDNVCQLLATCQLTLGMIKKSLAPESKDFFDQTLQYLALASQEIRNLSHRLAPAFFDDATLEDAFKNLLKTFNVENKYEIFMSFDESPRKYPISLDIQLNLYRILQEQLKNILKHANATTIKVEVIIRKNILQMRIADNGVGFDVDENKAGIGLANMNRRSQLFSGNFTIDSTIGNGCKIVVEMPLSSTN